MILLLRLRCGLRALNVLNGVELACEINLNIQMQNKIKSWKQP